MLTYPAYVTREVEFERTVRINDRGVVVKRVQEWLNIHGQNTTVDGKFGDATKKCLQVFQDRERLQVTGTVQKETWTALVAPLTEALAAFDPPSGASIGETVLRVAKQHLKQHPMEVGGDNRGPWVRIYVGGNEGPDWRWCAGFVTFVIKQACSLLPNAKQPIKGSFSCDSLAYQAKEAGLFTTGSDVANGNVPWSALGRAQLFLVRRAATDWTHTGFSYSGDGSLFSTVEGNTNDDGSANGYEVCERTRSVPGKDFIRLDA